MTRKAHALGMSRTTFRNASGLPNSGQKSTARDMATLAQALLRRFPHYYHYFSTKEFAYKGRRYNNHNKLLKSYYGTDGIKTGYIRASGFNLVASVERKGRRVIAVVFGGRSSRSRDRHMVKLLDRSFDEILTAQGIQTEPPSPGRNPFQVAEGGGPLPGEAIKVAADAKNQRIVGTLDEDGNLIVSGRQAVAADIEPAMETEFVSQEPLGAFEPVEITNQGFTVMTPGVVASEEGSITRTSLTSQEVAALVNQPGSSQSGAGTKKGAWTIQVGAFRQFKLAQRAANRALDQLPSILGSSKPLVQQITVDNDPMYRAQLTGLSRTTAKEACRQFEAMNQGCLVISPRAYSGSLPSEG